MSAVASRADIRCHHYRNALARHIAITFAVVFLGESFWGTDKLPVILVKFSIRNIVLNVDQVLVLYISLRGRGNTVLWRVPGRRLVHSESAQGPLRCLVTTIKLSMDSLQVLLNVDVVLRDLLFILMLEDRCSRRRPLQSPS